MCDKEKKKLNFSGKVSRGLTPLIIPHQSHPLYLKLGSLSFVFSTSQSLFLQGLVGYFHVPDDYDCFLRHLFSVFITSKKEISIHA